jgi:hypothetical protein
MVFPLRRWLLKVAGHVPTAHAEPFGHKLVVFEKNHRSLIAALVILVTSLELWGLLHNAFVTPDPISPTARKVFVSTPRRDWADVELLLTCFDPRSDVFRGVYRINGGPEQVTPVDVLLILQLAIKNRAVTVDHMNVEIQTATGWELLRKLPNNSVKLHIGWESDSKEISMDDPDIESIYHVRLDAGSTYAGHALFDYTDPATIPLANPNSPTNPYYKFRVTLHLLGKEKDVFTQIVTADRWWRPPMAGPDFAFKVVGAPRDLRNFERRRYSPPDAIYGWWR